MRKKKTCMSLFSTLVQEINEPSNEYHLIDQEYFAAFNSLDDIQQFHNQLTEKQQTMNIEEETDLPREQEIDMKSFAQKYLVDLPEKLNLTRTPSQEIFTTEQPINWSPKGKSNNSLTQSPDNRKRKSTTPVKLNSEINNKRQRRNIRDLPQSSEFIFMSDHNNRKSFNSSKNIFDSLQDETPPNQIVSEHMDSILFTLNDKQSTNNGDKNSLSENPISIELAEASIIKDEPIESEPLIIETKEEPKEFNMTSTNPMGFGTSEYSGDLDNYVQNIHLLRQSSSTNSLTSSRPKRIRKRKKLYSDESELITRPKKSLRKKRPSPPSQIPSTLQFTDAEIEQQFGERLPLIKSDPDDDTQHIANSRIIIEFEPVIHLPQTPIEKARAKLTSALGRGHDPDTYLLKIRSREHKIIEVQLAIYSTADWYSHRTKILSKIEEALRGLRVSWTKIDIHVDDFDIQISTSSQTSSISPPSSLPNNNASWFLKILSESSPLIVHIHDRRFPQQRLLIKCSCPECSPASLEHSIDSSLPVIVNVSPATTPTRRLTPPTILNKTHQTNISSLHNIDTTFFNALIYQWGRNTVISVTQCILDLALIVSVHASLSSLCVSPNYSKEEYKKKYEQIIDPLKCTLNDNEQILFTKTPMIARVVSMTHPQSMVLSKSPDILTFYNSIKFNKANIRSAKSMRNLITTSFSSPVPSPIPSNFIKNRTLILPKPTSSLSFSTSQTEVTLLELKQSHEHNRRSRRRSSQINRYDKYTRDTHEIKQQAHCTPIIELKPIMGGSTITTQNLHSFTRDTKEAIVVRDSQNNEMKKVTTIISKNTEFNDTTNEMASAIPNSARVIRLSIAKTALPNSTSPPTIRLVASSKTDSDHSPSHSIPSVNKGEAVPLVPKQINIIKPFSSSSTSITPAIKLSNPVLITNKSQPPTTK